MRSITLKVDVDTLRGTREGVPRLAQLLLSLEIPATFLFSVGPDHTGRALRRVFRRGFLGKVSRTSVASHYGIATLLYGTLLPGPDIGRLCRAEMRAVAEQGFEVGVHAYDHVKWQDGVAGASLSWTSDQMGRASDAFKDIFGFAPRVHGAAGWQVNEHVPAIEHGLGFEVASDTRGFEPFVPAGGGVLQIPTTLPTLDELVGVKGARAEDAVRRIFELTRTGPRNHVFTLHAELEGGAYLPQFEALLGAWLQAGFEFRTLREAARALDRNLLKTSRIESGVIEGRSGTLALQAR
ncbi:MAG TPA: polysaccharide deacetylase family protein [Steroidobacteraceae bacterium]|nr:polysaccharide deacetylase family protein [Steroidobacteraceae bacterium]